MYNDSGISGSGAAAGLSGAVATGTLARTGAPLALWMLIGTLLVVVGLILVRNARVLAKKGPADAR